MYRRISDAKSGLDVYKRQPYGMALFIGPKLEDVWKHKTSEEFEGFGYSGIKEELHLSLIHISF